MSSDCSIVDSEAVMETSVSSSGFIESIINMFSYCWPDRKCVSPVF